MTERTWRGIGCGLIAAGWVIFLGLVIVLLSGCGLIEPRRIVETVTIEKPVPVPCRVEPVARPAWEVSRVSAADDMVTINRALRAEIEQRRGYEIKLEAAVKACQ